MLIFRLFADSSSVLLIYAGIWIFVELFSPLVLALWLVVTGFRKFPPVNDVKSRRHRYIKIAAGSIVIVVYLFILVKPLRRVFDNAYLKYWPGNHVNFTIYRATGYSHGVEIISRSKPPSYETTYTISTGAFGEFVHVYEYHSSPTATMCVYGHPSFLPEFTKAADQKCIVINGKNSEEIWVDEYSPLHTAFLTKGNTRIIVKGLYDKESLINFYNSLQPIN